MRQQRCIAYKWVSITLILAFFYFQSFLQFDFQDKVNAQNLENKIKTHLESWNTAILPDDNMVDVANEKLYNGEPVTINEVKSNVRETVKGVFFTNNKDMFYNGGSWLTVYPSRGRLGNQMFQMASLIGIADTYGYRPLLTLTGFDINTVFDIPQSNIIDVDLNKCIKYQEDGVSAFAECDVTKYKEMSVLKSTANWTLDGYLQSYKHFVHIRDVIKHLFTFKSNIIEEARLFIWSNATSNMTRIGIHVRRGDFLSEYHTKLGRVTPGKGYFQKAMDLYRSKYDNVVFFVFSNDIAWCKDNLQDLGHKVIFSTFDHPGNDLAVMSLCDHMILSVGTFGWWGGWLSSGSVVYFNGYPRPGSQISKYFKQEDFYPPHWIGIS